MKNLVLGAYLGVYLSVLGLVLAARTIFGGLDGKENR